MSDDDKERSDGAGFLIGRHAKRLREVRGLTQERLAELSGVAADTIRRLEHDDFSPSLRTLRKVAGGLELPLSTMFEALEVGEVVDPEIGELVQLLRSHPKFPVKSLTAIVRAWVESGGGSKEE